MACGVVVVSNPLCFLLNKFNKSIPERQLKGMIVDFYDVDNLRDAKCQLLSDIRGMHLDFDLPHVPERRDGVNKAARIADDIFTLINFLDEKLKVSMLPRYVADNPDQLPSARLYDGDLQILLKLMEKMQDEIKELNIALADLAKRVQSPNNSAPVQALQATSAINSDCMRGESTAQPRGTGAAAHIDMTSRDSLQHSAHRSVESTSNRSAVVGALMPNTDIDTGTQPSLDWAAIAMVPPPVVIRNRFSAFTSTDDERDAESFTEYHSRRSLKRMRQSSQQLQSTSFSQP